jgi:rhodanese-related sulfurtransferase
MLALVVVAVSAGEARQLKTVMLAESQARRLAIEKPMPAYPADSASSGAAGVAVAAIATGPDGRVTSVEILEAPDEAIAAAMRSTLFAWEIPMRPPPGETLQYQLMSKVTFYFRIVKGQGRVANPEDLPGGPPPPPAPPMPSAVPPPRPSSPPVVRSGHGVPAEVEIGEVEFARLAAATPPPTLLDIRDRTDFKRGHRDGAVNIPRDELSVRAGIELDRSRPVVIDCSSEATVVCHMAASALLQHQKSFQVRILLP